MKILAIDIGTTGAKTCLFEVGETLRMIGSASAGSTGMSGATTRTSSASSSRRSSATVPLAPDEAKPWK